MTWQRTLPDGTVETFDLEDSNHNFYMTKVTDPQGNFVTINFDGSYRITTITDAIGQVSTISYVSFRFWKVPHQPNHQIVFRTCSFTYDSSNTYLQKITDEIGLQSTFAYGASTSFITMMKTPYGITTFYNYQPPYESAYYAARGLRVRYPDGTFAVLESYPGETSPQYSNSYFSG